MSAPKRTTQKTTYTNLKVTSKVSKPPAKSNATPANKGLSQATGTKSVSVKKTSQEIKVKAVPEPKKIDAKQEITMTAAKSIQSFCRHVLAKYEERRRKSEKEEYNALMDKLEKEAYLKLVKMQQELAEKERAREEEEKKRRAEHLKRCKRMLEAAFDGDCDGIRALLNEVDAQVKQEKFDDELIRKAVRMKRRMMLVECEDANGNTPLSECASGGEVEAINLLLEEGADPNSLGQFKRSPLYRAAFAGHLDACQALLQHGADPRLRADDGNNAAEVTSVEAIRQLLADWDIQITERMLSQIDAAKAKRSELERRKRELEENKLEELVKAAEKEHAMRQKMFNKASDELNKRISEHDHAASEGLVKPEITLQGIHDAEMNFEVAKLELEKASEKLAKAKLSLREKQSGENDESGNTPSDNCVKILIRDLHDVLMMDVGDKILNSGRWPLIIDTSGQAATFLRYRDTNYITAMSPKDMSAERIRLSLLGALRYGKILVLDMMDVDMFDTCCWRFDEAMPGLMDLIMTKQIMDEAHYAKLIRPSDGREYELKQFHPTKVCNFRFFIVVKSSFIAPSLLERTYPIKVFMPL